MWRSSRVLGGAVLSLIVLLCLPLIAARKTYSVASFAKYVQIPGAKPVGSETCTTCHTDVGASFKHAFHAQQGLGCEECHGPGSLHVDGGGDISKIISFSRRSPADANGVCLSCHERDAKLRNWLTAPHASNRLRCTDCHEIHSYGNRPGKNEVALNLMTPGQINQVEELVPEAKVLMQPRWQANDACLRCHESQRAQMSLPYHHPLREGKMSCADCHDPHGGPAANNLRMANTRELCLSCHAQYRGPYAYQHPPVAENCLLCHSPHGSPNTNILSVSEPALCLQCHAGHHNGAGLPLTDRCTNCHGSIHGTDVPTPSGGSRFIDKGPSDPALRATFRSVIAPASAQSFATSQSAMAPSSSTAALARPIPSHAPIFAAGAAGGALGMLPSGNMAPLSGGNMETGDTNPAETQNQDSFGAYSITPGSYRFIDKTGFGGRVGEYDSLQQSAGADAATAYVATNNRLTVVTRANVLSGEDYQAASQITASDWAKFGFDLRSLVQQQDHYNFYAFPVLDVPPGSTTPPDTTTDLIPSHTTFAVTRRIGKAYAQVKVPNWPVHLFVNGDWQARVGVTQFAYLDENTTPAVYAPNPTPPPTLINTTCGLQCHYNSRFQSLNYTTRNIGGGADVDLGPVRLTYQHTFSSFNDRLVFPTGSFTGPFTPENEGISVVNPPPSGPPPRDFPAGNYPIDIPSPSQASSDRVSLNWVASSTLTFNGNVNYTRLTDTFTNYPQNVFGTDETLSWLPVSHLRVTGDYHQQNLINDFTPYYSLFGNVSYHRHWEGVRLDYELPKNFDVEGYYRYSGITRSNASLWPQFYSMDNTDLQRVVPSSTSNTTGLALRYHPRTAWSARAGYEWTGTDHPGYLLIPRSNNRIFADEALTPVKWLTFSNDTSILVQNAFPSVPLPNDPTAPLGFGTGISGLPPDFERRNRLYVETASASLRPLPDWNLGFGYSYQQNNLNMYMAFQNDASVNYVVDEPLVPYKQISQSYWGDTSYTVKKRLGLNLRLTYNSARSGYRPDLNAANPALFGNQGLIASGTFDPVMFSAALNNLSFSSTQISEVIVPQWIGQSKAFYMFPHKFEGGMIFYYGSYRDYWNPDLNGVLRTFNVYVGRSW